MTMKTQSQLLIHAVKDNFDDGITDVELNLLQNDPSKPLDYYQHHPLVLDGGYTFAIEWLDHIESMTNEQLEMYKTDNPQWCEYTGVIRIPNSITNIDSFDEDDTTLYRIEWEDELLNVQLKFLQWLYDEGHVPLEWDLDDIKIETNLIHKGPLAPLYLPFVVEAYRAESDSLVYVFKTLFKI